MIASLGIVDTKKMIAAIKEGYGLDLTDYTLTTIKHRFGKILDSLNINQVDDFVEQLKRNNINYEDLLDILLIETTELFRDPSLWRELKETYLPEISNSPGSKIWMAGISSGEELYSLMVLMQEMNLKNTLRVEASSPSQVRIDRIKKGGQYDLKKMELGEANYTRLSGKFEFPQYYKVNGTKAEMDISLLSGVEFTKFNISQEEVKKTYRLVIFRNILIQYNLPLYEKVVRKLIDSITVGGYLVIGNMETLEHSEVGKKMQLVNSAEKIYRKRVD
jgi:chemotaxis protein methyltransferase CheR